MARTAFSELRPIVVLESLDWSALPACGLVLMLNDQEVAALGNNEYRSIFKADNREFDLYPIVKFAWEHGYFDQTAMAPDDVDPDKV